MRVVSLLPSATEVVVALGHADRLVGRSHECDFPPGVERLPVVSRPRREPVGTSAEIHRGVIDLLEQVLSIYRVDAGALREAAPDLIITQDLCRVCAVAEDEVVAAAREHLEAPVDVLTSSPVTLAEVLDDVVRIGEALGDRAAGITLAESMRADLDALARRTAALDRPRVVVIEWADPLIAAGHWTPELVEAAGAQPVPATGGAGSLEELFAGDPDVVLVAPCGYDLERALEDHEVLAALDGWEELRAVRAGRVAFADGSAYFNRPGPRLVTSAEIVAAVVHGIGPATALEGTAWRFVPVT